jgi:hypothetical protein
MWGAGFVLLAGLVAGLIIAFPSPDPPKEAQMTNIPGDVVKQDKPKPFAPRQENILGIAQKFVATAVARHHVEDSWDLVAPSMRQGFTKKRWAKGEIPVVPFPVWIGKWRVGYSVEHEVDLQVALFAKPKSKIRPIVFDLTLQHVGPKGHKRWLVASFTPAPAAGGDFGNRTTRFGRNAAAPPPDVQPKQTSATWLLLPAGIFGMLLVVLGVLGWRSWRGARTYRAYVRDRQTSSSRPS